MGAANKQSAEGLPVKRRAGGSEVKLKCRRCPQRCHRCGLLGGQVMPWCMGTAAMSNGPHDLSQCTCHGGACGAKWMDSDVLNDLVSRVEALEKLLAKSGREVSP